MTSPLIILLSYSLKIFAVKTFANCPETAKFTKVFTREKIHARQDILGYIGTYMNVCIPN